MEIGVERGISTDRAIRERIQKLNKSLVNDFTRDNKDLHIQEVKKKRSLEEEFERPEVQALLRKYNPKSTDFSDFEDSAPRVSEDLRAQYRNRVESHYKRLTSADYTESSGYQSELPPSPPDTTSTRTDSWPEQSTHSRDRSLDSDMELSRPMLDRNRFIGVEEAPKPRSVSPVAGRQGSRFTTNRLAFNSLDDTDNTSKPVTDYSSQHATDYASKHARDNSNRLATDYTRKPITDYNRPAMDFANKYDMDDTVKSATDYSKPPMDYTRRSATDTTSRAASDLTTKPSTDFTREPITDYTNKFSGVMGEDSRSDRQNLSSVGRKPVLDSKHSGRDSDMTPNSVSPRVSTNKPDKIEPLQARNDDFIAFRSRKNRTVNSLNPSTGEKSTTPVKAGDGLNSLPQSDASPRNQHKIMPTVELPKLSPRFEPSKISDGRKSPLKTEPPKKFVPSKIEPAKKFTPIKSEPLKIDETKSKSLPASFRNARPTSPSPDHSGSPLPTVKSPVAQRSKRPMNPHEYAVTNSAVHKLLQQPAIIEPQYDSDNDSLGPMPEPVFNKDSLGIDLYASRIAMGGKPYNPSECSERSSRLDPHTYQSYTAGLLHSTRKSDRFLRMQKFYGNIERASELEHELVKSPTGPCDRRIKKNKEKDKEVQSELTEVMDDIKAAQKKDRFVHDLGKVKKFQWDPQRERGLLNRPKSLGDLKKVFEDETGNMNNKTSLKEEPIKKRQLSFEKLKEKYTNDGTDDRKSQDKVPKSPDGKKRMRNNYEVYVGARESDSSSSESGLHVRSISTPHQTSAKQPTLQYSNSYKQSRFGDDRRAKADEPGDVSLDNSKEMENYFLPDRVQRLRANPIHDRFGEPVPKSMDGSFTSVSKLDDSVSSKNDTVDMDSSRDESVEPQQTGLRKFAAAKRYWGTVTGPSRENIMKSYVKEEISPQRAVNQARKLSGNLGQGASANHTDYSRPDQPLKASSPVTAKANVPAEISEQNSLSPRRTEPPKRWSPRPSSNVRGSSPYDHLRRGPSNERNSPRSPYQEKQELTSRWVNENLHPELNDSMVINDSIEEIQPSQAIAERPQFAAPGSQQNSAPGQYQPGRGFSVDPDPQQAAAHNKPKTIEQRAMSTSALTDGVLDSDYGKLGKWSKINVAQNLDKPVADVAELTEGNLQKWSAMDLHARNQSFDTESQDTMIVKDVNENEHSYVQEKMNKDLIKDNYTNKANNANVVEDIRGKYESGYSSAVSPDSPRALSSAKSAPDVRVSDWNKQPLSSQGTWHQPVELRRRDRDLKPRPVSDYEGWHGPAQVYATSPGAPARPLSPRWPRQYDMKPAQSPYMYETRPSAKGMPEYTELPRSRSTSDYARDYQDPREAPRHHLSTSDIPRTPPPVVADGPADRRRRDEEDARRKHYLSILNEENKRKRAEEERRALEQRRHNDYFLPKQKSPIPEDRFDGLQPPRLDKKHKPLEIRGKARALYSFKAQNIKELSFRKGDVIYLLRQIDPNWYEAERHGMRGIVPVNYIEVIKSIEEAHSLAQKQEGTASLKYRFRKQNPIELDADKGDIVRLVRRVDENWYEARLHNQQGIIPASYLNVNQEPDTPFITPAPSLIGSVTHSTVTTPGPGTPVRPLSPLVPDPLSPPEWDFTKFYLPGMPVQRADSREHTLKAERKHHTLPRDFVSVENAQRDFSSPPRNRYHSESSLGNDPYHQSDNRYSTIDSRRSDDYQRRPAADYYDGRRDYADDKPLQPYRVLFSYTPMNDDELEIVEGDHVYVLEKCDDGWFVGTSTRTGQFGTFPGNYVQPI